MNAKQKIGIFVVVLLVADQVLKIWIKTHMTIGESISVFGNWFQLLFIENKGMAFGMQWGGDIGKYLLSIFRVIAAGLLGWYLHHLIKLKASGVILAAFGLILAGAIGNIIDSWFYGLAFSESTRTAVATLFPAGGGYADFLQGKVVDMFYFPIIDTILPEWLPIWGGRHFSFFDPIFNLADSYITVGVALIILFYKRYVAVVEPHPSK